MNTAYQSGFIYELRAAKYLRAQGYKILERRFRAVDGEIDLIARDGDVIVFIEVKARPQNRLGVGAEAVDFDKMRRVYDAAGVYLSRHAPDAACRFDILEFTRAGVRHMKNAF